MKKKALLIGLAFFVSLLQGHSHPADFPVLKGPYLGQKPPGMTPEIFAPGVVSSEHQEHSSLAFSPESYIIFSRDSRRFDSEGHLISGDRKLMISFKDKDGRWLEAIDMGPLFANTRFPSVSPDGKYLFFTKYAKGGNEDFYWVEAKIIEDLKQTELKQGRTPQREE